jgi:hypothetical protein
MRPSADVASDTAGLADVTAELAGISTNRAEEGTSAATQNQTVLSGLSDEATLTLQSVEETPIETSTGEPAISVTSAPATDAKPPQGSLKEGRWVINLLSDPNKALAERFAASARDRGVPVEENRSEVKGREFWRVQITGFGTMSEARAHAEEVKTKLRLKDVWIFKEQG